MSALVMVQALFKKAWLPVTDLPLAKKTRFRVIEPQKTDASLQQKSVNSIEQMSRIIEKAAAPSIQHLQAPSGSSKSTDQQKPLLTKTQPARPGSENLFASDSTRVSSLAVPAPEQFHVAATMMTEHWGIVVSLPQSHAGLQGQDYLMLSKLISAFQQICGHAVLPVEFDFFNWPPKRGIASTLNDETFGLNALKGFLHKKALRKQCSWVVLDESLARFCFQKPELDAFQTIARGRHVLLASPSISKLQADPQLKKELWGKLQVLVIQSKTL